MGHLNDGHFLPYDGYDGYVGAQHHYDGELEETLVREFSTLEGMVRVVLLLPLTSYAGDILRLLVVSL